MPYGTQPYADTPCDDRLYLFRYLYPAQLVGGADTGQQAEQLVRWVRESFRLLAENPPRLVKEDGRARVSVRTAPARLMRARLAQPRLYEMAERGPTWLGARMGDSDMQPYRPTAAEVLRVHGLHVLTMVEAASRLELARETLGAVEVEVLTEAGYLTVRG